MVWCCNGNNCKSYLLESPSRFATICILSASKGLTDFVSFMKEYGLLSNTVYLYRCLFSLCQFHLVKLGQIIIFIAYLFYSYINSVFFFFFYTRTSRTKIIFLTKQSQESVEMYGKSDMEKAKVKRVKFYSHTSTNHFQL